MSATLGLGLPSEPAAALARNWWVMALRGGLALLFGVAALVSPVSAMLSLALVFAAYLLVDGVLALTAAWRAAERHQRWALLAAEGMLDIVMGLLAASFPGGAVLGFVLVVAAWAVVTGALMLGAAFQLHPSHGRFWLGLGGVVSLLWGLLLLGAPLAGALVLTWWVAAYAILFGVAMLVLAARLRSRHVGSG